MIPKSFLSKHFTSYHMRVVHLELQIYSRMFAKNGTGVNMIVSVPEEDDL
jgi:hypothetical protein